MEILVDSATPVFCLTMTRKLSRNELKTDRSPRIGADSGAVGTIPVDVLRIVELGEKVTRAKQSTVVDCADKLAGPDRPCVEGGGAMPELQR